MKAIKFFAVAALMAVSTGASAQFTNGGSPSASSSVNTDGWSSFYFQWNPSSLNSDNEHTDDQSFTGLTLGYSKAINIMQTSPLYLEIGAALQYSFYTIDPEDEDDYSIDPEDEDDYYYYYYLSPSTRSGSSYYSDDYYYYDEGDIKWNMFSIKVPVSLTYDIQVSEGVSIAPYGGLTARFNLFGSKKNGDSKSRDIFEKKVGKSYVAKRFQLGWQIGANVKFNHQWFLGVSYGTDFSEIAKKTKISTTSITAGLIF